jgi:hypothetical protein
MFVSGKSGAKIILFREKQKKKEIILKENDT